MSLPLGGAVLALDVDGVLLDPLRGGVGRWTDELERRWAVSAECVHAAFFQRDEWRRVSIGELALEPVLAAAIAEMGWPVTTEDFIACWFEADCHVNAEVAALAAAWAEQGARLALATTQEHRRAAFLAERLGAHVTIDAFLYSGALGCQKPSSDYFVAATTALGVRPAQIVLVDDLLANVEAARLHGWRAVHYRGQRGWRDEIQGALESAAIGPTERVSPADGTVSSGSAAAPSTSHFAERQHID